MQQLGRYQIVDKLGEGAMGVVYRAFDPMLERVMAIKTIRLDLAPAEHEDFEQRFFREARSAARLNHPAITTIFDAGRVDNVAYIAMELLEGQDLRHLIVKDGRPDPDRIAAIIARVAEGLDYAHEHGVVHRDIKPGNIMLLKNGQVKIADFGIARLQTSSHTMTQMVIGTPKYMSPEQILGKAVDGRSDIFSLGVVLYQLLTATTPFEGDTVTTVMYKVLHEPAPRPSTLAPNLPSGFEYILARALAKNPDDRYQRAAEMAADLRRFHELVDATDWNLGQLPVALPPARAVDDEPTRPLAELERLEQQQPEQVTLTDDKTLRLDPVPRPLPPGAPPVVTKPAPRRSGWVWAGALVLVAVGLGFYWWPSAPTEVSMPPAAATAPPAPVAPAKPAVVAAAPAKAAAAAQPAGKGVVQFAIAPWGEIFVDGKSQGVSPPLTELTLSSGSHEVEVRNETFKPYHEILDVQDGSVSRVKHKFEAE